MAAPIDRGPRGAALLLLASLGVLLSGCGGKSTGEWIAQLRAADAADRLHAIKALGERSREADVVAPALADVLRDENAFVRRDAAGALGRIGAGAAPAVPALLAATRDANAAVRKEAVRALRRIDPAVADRAGLPAPDDPHAGH